MTCKLSCLCACLLAGSALLWSCSAPAPQVILAIERDVTVHRTADLSRVHPVAPETNILSTPLAQTDDLSQHFVQIRDREAPHTHAAHDLVVTLVAGHGTMHVAGRAIEMRSGDSALILRGQVHYFVNTGDGTAAAVVTFVPPYDGKDNVPAHAP